MSTSPAGAPDLLNPPVQSVDRISSVELLRSDSAPVIRLLQGAPWGIYLDGAPVIEADSVVGFDYRQDTRISDYPLEDGNFETYNKVGTPYEVRVRMTKGGNDAARAAFLQGAEDLVNSFDVYDVVTPERIYTRANVQRYDYQRTASNGVGLITIDFFLIEIRAFAHAELSDTKTAAGADAVSGGRVQAQTPSPAVTNFVGKVPPPATTNFVGLVPPPTP